MIESILVTKTLCGAVLEEADAARLERALGPTAEWLISFMRRYPVMGSCFTLAEEVDDSGLGVDMQWMRADAIISEATEAHPGIEALARGYVPFGACLTGSGDYYFVDMNRKEPRVVRVVHTAAAGGGFDERQVEQVSATVAAFIARATIE